MIIIWKMFNFVKNIGTVELLIIAFIIVLFFGGKKINELARGMGESKKELKKVTKEIKGDEKEEEGGDGFNA